MKTIAHITLAASGFYLALFIAIPLTSYVLAWIILAFFLFEIVVSLHLLYTSNKSEEKVTKIILSKEEINLLVNLKLSDIDIVKVIETGMTIQQMAPSNGEYTVILIRADRPDVVDKIKTVINESKGT